MRSDLGWKISQGSRQRGGEARIFVYPSSKGGVCDTTWFEMKKKKKRNSHPVCNRSRSLVRQSQKKKRSGLSTEENSKHREERERTEREGGVDAATRWLGDFLDTAHCFVCAGKLARFGQGIKTRHFVGCTKLWANYGAERHLAFLILRGKCDAEGGPASKTLERACVYALWTRLFPSVIVLTASQVLRSPGPDLMSGGPLGASQPYGILVSAGRWDGKLIS